MERVIEVSTTLPVEFDSARAVLTGDPGAVFGWASAARDEQARRFHAELAVDLGGGSVRQSIVLHAGVPRAAGDAVVLPVSWHGGSWERLVPSFAGEFEASPERSGTRLVLRGAYTVPLGLLGRAGDGLVGHRVAGRSLSRFLDDVVTRIETVAPVPRSRLTASVG